MKYEPFKLERYFAEHEFSVGKQLSGSDCEAISLNTLFELFTYDEKKEFMNMPLKYTESNGSFRLREEIARLYHGFSPDEIFVAAPEECIFLTLNSFLEKGDRIIVLHPVYQSLSDIPKAAGCEVIHWSLKNREGKWEADLDFLEDMIGKNIKALLINFPHNPTGFMPSPEQYSAIVELAEKNNVFVFSDEMYWLLEHEYREPLPPFCTLYENSVSLFGMSKSFGLPGLRIGWLGTKNRKLYSSVSHLKDYTTICSSAPSEELARIALRHKDYFISRSRDIIRNNIDYASGVFEDIDHILQWNQPSGSSVAFPCFKGKVSSSKIAEDLVRNMDLLMLPGALYNYDDRYFRLGFGRKIFKDALYALKKYLEAAYERGGASGLKLYYTDYEGNA